MYSPTGVLSTPSDFNFPFTPYPIQQQLMEDLYGVLENKQIGIFESPTGTGKSLTLTCAAIKWLEDHESLVRKELHQRLADVEKEVLNLEKKSEKVSDWIKMHCKLSQQRHELFEIKELNKLLNEFEEQLDEIKSKKATQMRCKADKTHKLDGNVLSDTEIDLNVSLEDISSTKTDRNVNSADNCEKYRDIQIFFCSRTHTQLAQVVKEIKRTVYGERVRCVSLASRQQLCIHKQLRKLNNTALINELCLDMSKDRKSNVKQTSCDTDCSVQKKVKISQNSSSITKTECEFKSQALVKDLTELSLVDVLDIEDLVTEGEKVNACPYYAARKASELAQIIMLPYQLLLHKRTRQQCGINLKGSVIIIDEAHNLLDTISKMYSCQLNLEQLQISHQQILDYKIKYSSRFSSSNLLSINQLLYIVKRLIKILETPTSDDAKKNPSYRMLCTYELMSEGDFFNIDLYQLLIFFENFRFAQKLQGFSKRLSGEPSTNGSQSFSSGKPATTELLQRLQKNHIGRKQDDFENSAKSREMQQCTNDNIRTVPCHIRPLLSFLEALCGKAEDSRIIIQKASKAVENNGVQTGFKYMLLNPGAHFQDIIKEARAIVVAGGTMQPTAELTEQLFHSCPERVKLRIYDHVVPVDAVLPFVVTKSPSGRKLCFNYAQRASHDMLMDLGTILENLCSVVPAGLVCFLPSYDYLDTVYSHLQKSGVLQRISSKKKVFKEPRNNENINTTPNILNTNPTVEKILNDFAKAIKCNQGGALLLSVVGAKLSEGLNFTDDLGRGVVVVGLPFPNLSSPELQERMSYIDMTFGAGSGSEYYENLCMKAVNQCIGRSVRHIRDYACVYLLDERYDSVNIKRKLPQWISNNLKIATAYGLVQSDTVKFFKRKKYNFNNI